MIAAARTLVDQARTLVARYDTARPHTAGRVRQTVGGLLVADALVGLEDPLTGKQRPGLFGGFFLIAFGLVFVIFPYVITHTGPDTDTRTTGTVASRQVDDGHDGRTCAVTATFTVAGQTYTAGTNGASSGLCQKFPGDEVDVDYQAADPRRAQVHDGSLAFIVWVFGGSGVLVALSGVVTIVVRAVTLVLGVRLWLRGRTMVRQNPASDDEDGLVAEVRSQFTSLVTAARTAAPGRFGLSLSSGSGPLRSFGPSRTAAAPQPAAASASAPTSVVAPAKGPGDHVAGAPAAGWYPTADGAYLRWHDGTGWTDQLRPAGQ